MEVPWGPRAEHLSDIQKAEIFNLLFAILEVPLFVKQGQLASMKNVISILRLRQGATLERKLREHRESRCSYLDVSRHYDILYENRIFYRGLLAIAHVYVNDLRLVTHGGARVSASKAFADVLEEVRPCRDGFHST